MRKTWIETDEHGIQWRVQRVTGEIARQLCGRNSYLAYRRITPFSPYPKPSEEMLINHAFHKDNIMQKIECSYFDCRQDVCEDDLKFHPPTMRFCQKHRDEVNDYIDRNEIHKLVTFWVKANGGAKGWLKIWT